MHNVHIALHYRRVALLNDLVFMSFLACSSTYWNNLLALAVCAKLFEIKSENLSTRLKMHLAVFKSALRRYQPTS